MVAVDVDSSWPPDALRNSLENLSADFHSRILPGLRGVLPQSVWHYTSASGAHGILSSRRLWLTSSLSAGDRQEVHWGNALVCAAALRLDEELGGHPALDALLNDHRASLFLNEPEIFLACFTDAHDDERQWHARSTDGAALVVDSQVLSRAARVSSVNATRLLRVQYDSLTVRTLATDYYRRVLDLAASNPPAQWHWIAQWLMETGFLAFFAKRASWSWEREFRLVGRSILRTGLIQGEPRRLELELGDGILKAVVLGPDASAALERELRDVVSERWPGEVIEFKRAMRGAGKVAGQQVV